MVFGQTLFIPYPSLSEQQSIATFLNSETARIDALIEKKQRLVELLKEKRQAVITQAVTKGLDPKVPMKDSGVEWLGEVPENWQVVPFKHVVHFQEGPGIMAEDFRDEGIPLLRISNVTGRYVQLEGCNHLDPERVSKKWSHFQVNQGELLISASASMGTVSEVTADTVGAIPYTGIIRLTQRSSLVHQGFIRHFVVSGFYIFQIDLLKAGATIQHYGPTHLRQIIMMLPPMTEQKLIVEFIDWKLSEIDMIVRKTEESIKLIRERRSALITAAVTGQIDVRDAV